MDNVLFIRASDEDRANWKSMDVILNQVSPLTKKLKENFFVLDIQLKNDESIQSHLKDIDTSKNTHLIYYCSGLNFKHIISELKEYFPKRRHYLPIFGNLTLHPYKWAEYESFLQDEAVCFLCLSQATQMQTKKLFINAKSYVIPPSVDPKFVSSTSHSNPNVFGFAGRIVEAKGILKLIQIFKNPLFSQKKLLIAGSPHTYSYRLHGVSNKTEDIEKILENLPLNIIYEGDLNQDELNHFFDKIDCLLAPSTYYDEDFGISVQQALAKGVDAIISDWGGHKDFIKIFNLPKLVPDKTQNPPTISSSKMVKSILNYKKDQTSENRYKELININYSQDSIAQIWTRVLNFEHEAGVYKLSPLFQDYIELYRKNKKAPFRNLDSTGLSIYEKIYSDF